MAQESEWSTKITTTTTKRRRRSKKKEKIETEKKTEKKTEKNLYRNTVRSKGMHINSWPLNATSWRRKNDSYQSPFEGMKHTMTICNWLTNSIQIAKNIRDALKNQNRKPEREKDEEITRNKRWNSNRNRRKYGNSIRKESYNTNQMQKEEWEKYNKIDQIICAMLWVYRTSLWASRF